MCSLITTDSLLLGFKCSDTKFGEEERFGVRRRRKVSAKKILLFLDDLSWIYTGLIDKKINK